MSFKKLIFASVLAATGTWVAADTATQTGLHVMDSYARSALATSKTGAAFMQIVNGTDQDDRLIAATADVAKRTMLHTHVEQEGVMRMVHVMEGFEIHAGETLSLERGGHHIMLMGLTQSLVQGDMIGVTLIFEKAGERVIEIPVDLTRKPGHGAHGATH